VKTRLPAAERLVLERLHHGTAAAATAAAAKPELVSLEVSGISVSLRRGPDHQMPGADGIAASGERTNLLLPRCVLDNLTQGSKRSTKWQGALPGLRAEWRAVRDWCVVQAEGAL